METLIEQIYTIVDPNDEWYVFEKKDSVQMELIIDEFSQILSINEHNFDETKIEHISEQFDIVPETLNELIVKCKMAFPQIKDHYDIPETLKQIESIKIILQLTADKENNNAINVSLIDIMLDNDQRQYVDLLVLKDVIAPVIEIEYDEIIFSGTFRDAITFANSKDISVILKPVHTHFYKNGQRISITLT